MYIALCCVEFRNNGHWQRLQVHPKLIPSKPQPYTPVNNKRSCAKGNT